MVGFGAAAMLPLQNENPRLSGVGSHVPAQFTDITAQAGLLRARNISGSPDNKQFLLEEMGCGVAFFDYDNDGWLDIFLVNGSSFDPAVRDSKPTSYLFRNNRDGTFTDVSQKAGLTHSGWGQACCIGDYDNDGWDDLFVSYFGHNVLYHNNGDGTFTDVSEEAGVAGSDGRWGAGCCFLDYDRDGHLDLFVANYVNFDPARAPKPGASAYCSYNDIPVPCGPLGYAGGTNILYRNRGNGTFVDVSEASGIARPTVARSPAVLPCVIGGGAGGFGFRAGLVEEAEVAEPFDVAIEPCTVGNLVRVAEFHSVTATAVDVHFEVQRGLHGATLFEEGVVELDGMDGVAGVAGWVYGGTRVASPLRMSSAVQPTGEIGASTVGESDADFRGTLAAAEEGFHARDEYARGDAARERHEDHLPCVGAHRGRW